MTDQQTLDFTIKSKRVCPHCNRPITGKSRKDLLLALQSHRRWAQAERAFRRGLPESARGRLDFTYRGIHLWLTAFSNASETFWDCYGVKEDRLHTGPTALRALKGWFYMRTLDRREV